MPTNTGLRFTADVTFAPGKASCTDVQRENARQVIGAHHLESVGSLASSYVDVLLTH